VLTRPALRNLLGGRGVAGSQRLRLDLPESFDYGTTIPFGVAIDSAMTAADHVRRVSVLAGGNPFPEVASVTFSPASGRVSTSTRFRLNESAQEVVAVAEFSDGTAWVTRQTIKVAVSGCSAESGVKVGHGMPLPQPRLKMPSQARAGSIIDINTMISHWMESGLRIDSAGRPIPRRIINRMACTCDGEQVFVAELTPAIAANAYLGFSYVARASAVLTFTWWEDGGGVYRVNHPLEVI
jgi:predicted secreted protein